MTVPTSHSILMTPLSSMLYSLCFNGRGECIILDDKERELGHQTIEVAHDILIILTLRRVVVRH